MPSSGRCPMAFQGCASRDQGEGKYLGTLPLECFYIWGPAAQDGLANIPLRRMTAAGKSRMPSQTYEWRKYLRLNFPHHQPKVQKKPRNFLHYVPLYSTNYKENFSEKKCSKLGENEEGFNPLFSLIEIVAGSQQLWLTRPHLSPCCWTGGIPTSLFCCHQRGRWLPHPPCASHKRINLNLN